MTNSRKKIQQTRNNYTLQPHVNWTRKAFTSVWLDQKQAGNRSVLGEHIQLLFFQSFSFWVFVSLDMSHSLLLRKKRLGHPLAAQAPLGCSTGSWSSTSQRSAWEWRRPSVLSRWGDLKRSSWRLGARLGGKFSVCFSSFLFGFGFWYGPGHFQAQILSTLTRCRSCLWSLSSALGWGSPSSASGCSPWLSSVSDVSESPRSQWKLWRPLTSVKISVKIRMIVNAWMFPGIVELDGGHRRVTTYNIGF